MLKTTTALATVAAFLAAPAFAQKMDAPAPEPVVEAPDARRTGHAELDRLLRWWPAWLCQRRLGWL